MVPKGPNEGSASGYKGGPSKPRGRPHVTARALKDSVGRGLPDALRGRYTEPPGSAVEN